MRVKALLLAGLISALGAGCGGSGGQPAPTGPGKPSAPDPSKAVTLFTEISEPALALVRSAKVGEVVLFGTRAPDGAPLKITHVLAGTDNPDPQKQAVIYYDEVGRPLKVLLGSGGISYFEWLPNRKLKFTVTDRTASASRVLDLPGNEDAAMAANAVLPQWDPLFFSPSPPVVLHPFSVTVSLCEQMNRLLVTLCEAIGVLDLVPGGIEGFCLSLSAGSPQLFPLCWLALTASGFGCAVGLPPGAPPPLPCDLIEELLRRPDFDITGSWVGGAETIHDPQTDAVLIARGIQNGRVSFQVERVATSRFQVVNWLHAVCFRDRYGQPACGSVGPDNVRPAVPVNAWSFAQDDWITGAFLSSRVAGGAITEFADNIPSRSSWVATKQ